MNLFRYFTLVAILLGIFGCATTPQAPIPFEPSNLQLNDAKIGILSKTLPKPDVHLPGAACLLCLAAAEAGNSGLSKHVNTLSTDELLALPDKVKQKFVAMGAEAEVIQTDFDIRSLDKTSSKELNAARYDFSGFKDKGFTHVVVINVNQLGMERTYSNYIANTPPQAVFRANAYLVSLETNEYQWYSTINLLEGLAQWKEPPDFPGLTNTYYRLLAMGQEQITSPLKATNPETDSP